MMDAGLGILVSSIKIVMQYMAIQDSPKPDTDAIGDVQKLISTKIGQSSKCTEDARPLAYFHGICLKQDVFGDFTDFESHEGVDVLVDIGQVHEGGSMKQCNRPTVHVFLEFGPADSPETLVLVLELDVLS